MATQKSPRRNTAATKAIKLTARRAAVWLISAAAVALSAASCGDKLQLPSLPTLLKDAAPQQKLSGVH